MLPDHLVSNEPLLLVREVVLVYDHEGLLTAQRGIGVGLLVKGLKLRWFYKHALRDFLPDKILNKRKHGFGMPFGVWMREHPRLREIAMESLEDLRARKVVRQDFIDQLIRLHDEDHASYYGVFIWVFMQLEQWFKAHVDRVATVG